MHIRIAESVLELFPELQLVVLVVRGADNESVHPEVAAVLRQEEEIARGVFGVQKLSEHPNVACWRRAYSAFGAGSDYRSSVEAITKRVIKGGQIPTINTIVDLYNLTSLKYTVPVGGEDTRLVKGDVTLMRATGTETFIALGSQENDPPKTGEVVYVDESNEVLCRRFNWRESEKTKITPQTFDAILYIEGLPPVGEVELKEAAYFLGEHIKKFTGAAVESYLLKKSYPIVTI
ncbi:MAG: hypothetical protein HYV34_01405 [Candidatus Kerfeldbacteria bacterium]|nr:hypothetical protein [Candidatus Kerfeldbacteria bacterium]